MDIQLDIIRRIGLAIGAGLIAFCLAKNVFELDRYDLRYATAGGALIGLFTQKWPTRKGK